MNTTTVINYKPLEKQFKSRNFDFSLIKRVGDIAIYHKCRSGSKLLNYNYEVIRVLRHADYLLAGTLIPAAETFPSAEQWGQNGWTYSTLEGAEKRFNSLIGGKISEKNKTMDNETQPEVSNISNNIAENVTQNTVKRGRGRPAVLKPCIKCGAEIKTSLYLKNKGCCDTCKS